MFVLLMHHMAEAAPASLQDKVFTVLQTGIRAYPVFQIRDAMFTCTKKKKNFDTKVKYSQCVLSQQSTQKQQSTAMTRKPD